MPENENNIIMSSTSQPVVVQVHDNTDDLAAGVAKDYVLQAKNYMQQTKDCYNSVYAARTSLIALIEQGTNAITDYTETLISSIETVKTDAEDYVAQSGQTVVQNAKEYANIAKNYAEQAENAVNSGVSQEYLNQSKAFPTGDISSISNVLTKIKSYAHSTFDLSKFTVVGSPNITDDGIASGFANYPRIAYGTYDLTKKFKVRGRVIMNGTPTGNSQFLALKTTSATADPARGCGLYFNSTAIIFAASKEGQTTKYLNIDAKDWQAGDVIDYLVENDLTNITATIYVNGELFGTPRSVNAIDYALGSTTYASTNYFYGQSAIFTDKLDLKYCKVEVDGVEVFSGNKTGIDTIKPDDYTVAGTPTISADGVLSNVGLSNYLSKTLSLTYTNSYEVIIPLKTGLDISGRQRIIGGVITCQIGAVNPNWITIQCNTVNNQNAISRSLEIKANTNYLFKIVDDGTNYSVWYKEDIETWQQMGASATKTDNINLSGELDIGISGGVNNPFLGSIDLNAFKIYVDGNLVYQPCLKIPYTQSKTGSKIVNSIYRDRVNDMAEQFGYANYYTLDEDNDNFTLPQCELYGLIGPRTLRNSYRSGANYADIYSDRTLQQGGTCTSGVEVNLYKSYQSANDYVLSVPYSSKTTASFVPTVTGDWMANGIGAELW